MLKKLLVSVFTVVFVSTATHAFAGTTGWFNYSDAKIRNAKLAQAKKSLSYGMSYSRIRCKMQNGEIWMNVNTSRIFSAGWYGIMYGPKNRVDKAFAAQKNRGASIRSRIDLQTKNGSFTCLSWYRGA